MPSSKAGKSSVRNPMRKNDHCPQGINLDVIGAYDTSYPDIHQTAKGRGLPGNGPVPANPFGHEIPKPKVG